jgi:hypothetical protein
VLLKQLGVVYLITPKMLQVNRVSTVHALRSYVHSFHRFIMNYLSILTNLQNKNDQIFWKKNSVKDTLIYHSDKNAYFILNGKSFTSKVWLK